MSNKGGQPNPGANAADANAVGALWVLGAAVFGSGMAAVAKFAGARVGPVEVAFFRAVIGLVITLPFIIRQGRGGWVSGQPLLQVLRGVIASFVILCGFYAVVHIPLADFTVLAFTKVLFVVLLAVLMLGEKIHLRRGLAMIVGFLGILVIMRPTGTFEVAALVAVFGAFFVGINIILVKIVSRTDGTATLVLYSNIVQCLVLAAPAAYYWVTPDRDVLVALLGVGILGTLAQFCIVRGYTIAEASAVIPIDYSRVIFAALLGYLFFDERPDQWTWIGAGVIILSTLYIARREAWLGKRSAKPESFER